MLFWGLFGPAVALAAAAALPSSVGAWGSAAVGMAIFVAWKLLSWVIPGARDVAETVEITAHAIRRIHTPNSGRGGRPEITTIPLADLECAKAVASHSGDEAGRAWQAHELLLRWSGGELSCLARASRRDLDRLATLILDHQERQERGGSFPAALLELTRQ